MLEQDEEKRDLEEQKDYILSILQDIEPFLKRKDITDIMLNQDSHIWIDTFSGTIKTDVCIQENTAQMIMKVIARYNNKNLDKSNPIISGILPTGERFEGIYGEVAHFKTIFAIRKKSERIITLEDYVQDSFITEQQKEYIVENVKNKKNILVIGGTSSGKTTFTNACLNELSETTDRIIILEDTDELQCPAPNQIKLKSTAIIEMKMLLQSSMRLNPTRIIVGELRRGKETQELLKAWNSGHSGGLSTIHADDCNGGLIKLKQYLQEEIESDSSLLIANSVHILINIIKENNRRYVREISEVQGYDESNKKFNLKKIE